MKTATFDETKWKLVPIKSTEEMGRALNAVLHKPRHSNTARIESDCYLIDLAIAAAPEHGVTDFLRRPITEKELNDPEYMAAYIESMDEDFDICSKLIELLKADLLSISQASRESPYRQAGKWDQPLASLIEIKTQFLKM